MRKLSALFAMVTLVCGLTLATSTPASATVIGLGCRVSPGTIMTWSEICYNSVSATQYNAGFLVQNVPTPLSYSWSVPAGHTIYTGCGSTNHDCAVFTRNGELTVSVTLYYSGGGYVTYSATADIEPYCGNQFC